MTAPSKPAHARLQRLTVRAAQCLVLSSSVASAQTILTPPPNRGPGSVTLLTPGNPPRNVYLTGSPAFTTVNWGSPTQMRGFVYSVQRWLESDLTCCNAQVDGLTSTQWMDEGVQWPGAYIYRITAFAPDGSVGSIDTRYVRPAPVNPTNFTGTQSSGVVTLRWDAVPDVSWYELSGPGIPNGSFQVAPNQTFFVVRNLPSGPHTWHIGSVYSSAKAPAAVHSPPSQFPAFTLTVPD